MPKGVRYSKKDGLAVIEIEGNIWTYHDKGNWVVIPTNSYVKANGQAVMGRGLALQAKLKYPNLPNELGRRLKKFGAHVYPMSWNMVAFPVKDHWAGNAILDLILRSCIELVYYVECSDLTKIEPPIYLPKVGCGNGKLNWWDVAPILEKYLDDRFTIVK